MLNWSSPWKAHYWSFYFSDNPNKCLSATPRCRWCSCCHINTNFSAAVQWYQMWFSLLYLHPVARNAVFLIVLQKVWWKIKYGEVAVNTCTTGDRPDNRGEQQWGNWKWGVLRHWELQHSRYYCCRVRSLFSGWYNILSKSFKKVCIVVLLGMLIQSLVFGCLYVAGREGDGKRVEVRPWVRDRKGEDRHECVERWDKKGLVISTTGEASLILTE